MTRPVGWTCPRCGSIWAPHALRCICLPPRPFGTERYRLPGNGGTTHPIYYSTGTSTAEAPRCTCLACCPDYPYFGVCTTCGNKRCPGAGDHRNECTGSNEPGQPGSLYPARETP